MLFNSIEFALFLPIVFCLYWLVGTKRLQLQNICILAASYVFYGWWDYRFLFLLIFSTLLDFLSGLQIYNVKSPVARRYWLIVSVAINLGFLGFFKYFNFFADTLAQALHSIGFDVSCPALEIILPVGISFYTFHGLSYVFDVYYHRITPTNRFVDYSVFVSFFPLLVAGPIERATHLLPQVERPRTFDYKLAVIGLRQIVWGLFKKVVIADNCAEYANMIFNNHEHFSGSTLLLGAFFFTVQIYGDFSGYSDIALGTARLFGFDLLRNFAYPYFSRDIAEFWRRWHISLSSWFKDYVYIPLGGSRGGLAKMSRNTFIIFLVSGFWHGANWTFIAWGFLNALYFLPLLMLGKNRSNLEIVAAGRFLPSIREALGILITFCLTMFAWIFFRAESMSHAFSFIGNIFSGSLFSVPQVLPKDILLYVFCFFVFEWWGREENNPLNKLADVTPRIVRWVFYYLLVVAVIYFSGKNQEFIYFQF